MLNIRLYILQHLQMFFYTNLNFTPINVFYLMRMNLFFFLIFQKLYHFLEYLTDFLGSLAAFLGSSAVFLGCPADFSEIFTRSCSTFQKIFQMLQDLVHIFHNLTDFFQDIFPACFIFEEQHTLFKMASSVCLAKKKRFYQKKISFLNVANLMLKHCFVF